MTYRYVCSSITIRKSCTNIPRLLIITHISIAIITSWLSVHIDFCNTIFCTRFHWICNRCFTCPATTCFTTIPVTCCYTIFSSSTWRCLCCWFRRSITRRSWTSSCWKTLGIIIILIITLKSATARFCTSPWLSTALFIDSPAISYPKASKNMFTITIWSWNNFKLILILFMRLFSLDFSFKNRIKNIISKFLILTDDGRDIY